VAIGSTFAGVGIAMAGSVDLKSMVCCGKIVKLCLNLADDFR
jgi:hypothetical protein